MDSCELNDVPNSTGAPYDVAKCFLNTSQSFIIMFCFFTQPICEILNFYAHNRPCTNLECVLRCIKANHHKIYPSINFFDFYLILKDLK